MCLATPMKILQLDVDTALCEVGGVQRQVNIFLLQDQALQIGDYLLVHVGYGIEKIESDVAEKNRQLVSEAKNA
jgi:hydrogenase expression/formation protein HypC